MPLCMPAGRAAFAHASAVWKTMLAADERATWVYQVRARHVLPPPALRSSPVSSVPSQLLVGVHCFMRACARGHGRATQHRAVMLLYRYLAAGLALDALLHHLRRARRATPAM